MATKNKYVTAKLDWAVKWMTKMEKYLDKNPYDTVEDRITLKERKDGGVMPITSATIEQIHKDQRDTMKDYLDLLAVVKKFDVDDEIESSKEGYAGVEESIRMKLASEQKDERD